MEIDWVAKLTSRKFWMAICGLFSGIMIAAKVSEETATQITGIIMSAASVVAYILGEGLADAAGAKAASTTVFLPGEEKPPEEDLEEDDLK